MPCVRELRRILVEKAGGKRTRSELQRFHFQGEKAKLTNIFGALKCSNLTFFVNYPHKLKVRIIKKSKKMPFSRKYILQNTFEQVNLTEIDNNDQISEFCEFSGNSKKGPNCAGPNCSSQL